MGRKKPFIKKGEGVKFFLVHRSQKDPLYLAEDLGEHVLMPADPEQAMQSGLASTLNAHHGGPAARKKVGQEEKEKRLNEQMKYGIYYEDDYDYLQHLKEVNLNDDGEEAQEEVMKVGSVLIKTDAFGEEKKQTDKTNKLVLPSTVFASKFEEDVGYFNQAAPDHDPKIHWDPDIVRLLDEDAEINPEDDGELEDDFFVKANLEKGKKSQQRDDDDDDDDDEEDEEDDNFSNQADDDDEDDYYDDEEGSETKSMRDMERRSRFSEYSMTSSIVPRNEGLKLLDEQFERFYAQYDEDQIGALDTEDIEGFRGQDLVLNAALEEFNKMMEKKGLVTERVPKVSKKKQLPVLKEKNEDEEEEEEEDEEESNEQDENNNDKDDDEEDSCDSDSDDTEKEGEDGEVLRYSRKRDRDDRLDCESIISTYSNIYNHPSMIGSEESKIKLSKKTGLPLGVLQEKEKSKREIERIEHNIVRVLPDLPLKRDKNESKDEKKERKQAIKAHRRERRVEKKINKTAFKEEKKSQTAQITSTNNNKNVVKLPL